MMKIRFHLETLEIGLVVIYQNKCRIAHLIQILKILIAVTALQPDVHGLIGALIRARVVNQKRRVMERYLSP